VGSPLGDVDVDVLLPDAGEGEASAGYGTTGSDGGFVIGGLAPGQYVVSFEGGEVGLPGFYPGVASLDGAELVVVEASKIVDLVPVEVSRGAELSGVAVDGGGGPVAGLEVSAHVFVGLDGSGYEYWDPVGLGTSDESGRFSIVGLWPGRYVVRWDGGDEWISQYFGNFEYEEDTQRFDLGGGQVVDVGTVTVRPAAFVEGRVVDGAGNPVAEATVWAYQYREYVDAEADWELVTATQTDSSGVYELAGLENKTYLVQYEQLVGEGTDDDDGDDGELDQDEDGDGQGDGTPETGGADGSLETGGTPGSGSDPGSPDTLGPWPTVVPGGGDQLGDAAGQGDDETVLGVEVEAGAFIGVTAVPGSGVEVPDVVLVPGLVPETVPSNDSAASFGVSVSSSGVVMDPGGALTSPVAEVKTTARLSPVKANVTAQKGKRASIKVRVTFGGQSAKGRVVASIRGKNVASAKVKAGRATVSIPQKYLKKRTQRVKLVFKADGMPLASPAKTVTVRVK
jgi:hypothetical protein